MNNNLRWVATFLISTALSEEFQKFMEQTHFKTINNSGCFTGLTRKVFQSGVREGVDSIVYIHEPKSLTHWERYKTEFRPAAAKEFVDKYSEALSGGKIESIQATGELEVLKEL